MAPGFGWCSLTLDTHTAAMATCAPGVNPTVIRDQHGWHLGHFAAIDHPDAARPAPPPCKVQPQLAKGLVEVLSVCHTDAVSTRWVW